MYAACEIGEGGEIVSGTLTGILRFYHKDAFPALPRSKE
jgi:hypothetical protein